MSELISAIVTTYNREDALDAILRAFAAQTDTHFEVIVADDGSGPATARVVAAWSGRLGRPLAHVRHDDQGFRAAKIRNRAIVASAGEVCVFVDGDCIPRPDFMAAHRRLAEPGWFVAGNRVLLGRVLSERILRDGLKPEAWTWPRWTAFCLNGAINRPLPLVRLPLGPLRRLGSRAWPGLRSANLAVRRDDLVRVDGFDAAFSGWGLEDSDLVIRLIRAGVRRKDGRFATGVLHLWHPDSDRSRLPENARMLDQVIAGDRVRAIVGLSALGSAGATPPSHKQQHETGRGCS
ncbi:MAG TPA: glycosyltransferase family 2 protein [Xanthobacteraceae bacterium]|nr:glycosyltransferase family 2 protein [Xanthobacteraceae bacterium]